MNIFLTGSTGYIGSRVLPALLATGHQVTALVRTREAAAKISQEGVTPVIGDMQDVSLVEQAALAGDAVIHTASPGDETSSAADAAFMEAALAGLGTRKAAFIRTGGIWVYGPGSNITEDGAYNSPAIVAWREELDQRFLKSPGVRAILVEPGIVYGYGGGIPNVVTGANITTSEPKALTLIGDGSQHWGTVHVEDLADLYIRALEHAPHGSRFLAVNGNNPTTRELGEAASRSMGLDGRVQPESPAETVARLGAFGEAILMDQLATGEKARRELGWEPTRPTLGDELAEGYGQA